MTCAVYYNEFDPFAAAWLRELMKRRLIPEGEIDERSIADVSPDDLRPFRQCHFFAGIGGWPRALDLAGFPDDAEVWTGSCPCQPFSVAGKGLGAADARHLWPEFHRLIRERRPAIVIGEQVAGRAGLEWLAGVHADLEGSGYAVGAAVLPACSLAAPHRRERLFWVADAEHALWGPIGLARENGRDGPHDGRQEAHGLAGTRGQMRESRGMDDAEQPRERGRGILGRKSANFGGSPTEFGRTGSYGMDNPIRPRLEGHAGHEPDRNQPGRHRADTPRSTAETGSGFWNNAVWLAGSDGKTRRVKPGVRLLAHGIPKRVGRLRGFGNAIVPQVAAEFVRAFAHEGAT